MLADWLRGRGRDVITCVDPGSTSVGEQLREILLHHKGEIADRCEALLFMASRAQLVETVIRPALDANQIVVCDRYLLANVVYQAHAGGLDPEELWNLGRWVINGIEPDLTLVLDVPLEVALTRRGKEADRMESRAESFHQRVRNGFLLEAERNPERIRVIDASGSVDEIHSAICREVEVVLATDSGA